MRESHEREDEEDITSLRLSRKADLAYGKFKEGGSLLTKLEFNKLRDLVGFIYHVEKTKGETYSKQNKMKKKMMEWIARAKLL